MACLEIQLFFERQEPSIWEKNGELFIIDAEGFQNGTVILELQNLWSVPVNLTEVFLKEVEITNRSIDGEIVEVTRINPEKLQIITSIRQEILVNSEKTIPIIVAFSTETLDFDKKYAVGISWITKTGGGSSSRSDFSFLSLKNIE